MADALVHGSRELTHPFPPEGLTKAKLIAFQRMVEQVTAEQPDHSIKDDRLVSHFFAPGLYARALFIPKGGLVVGEAHRTGHMNMLAQGLLSVATEEGVITVGAPYLVTSQPGVKRVGYAHEDSIWITFHPTDLTDPAEIEKVIVMPESEYIALAMNEAAEQEQLEGKE